MFKKLYRVKIVMKKLSFANGELFADVWAVDEHEARQTIAVRMTEEGYKLFEDFGLLIVD